MHHASFTSPEFQHSHAVEPRAYCVECHAPQRSSAGTRDGEAGIGCASCHTVPAAHLAPGVARRAHAPTRDCRGCHDFDVPGTRAILQSTAREHALSRFASTSCDGCHMPKDARGRRDHRFNVSRNPDLLGRALAVSPARIEKESIVVHVSARGVGHRFPTGDIYRRVTIVVTAYDARGALVAGDTFHFGRDWDAHRASLRSRQAEAVGADSRLSEVPRELRIACPEAPARVHVTAEYERGASADGDRFEAFEQVQILDTDLEATRAE